APRHYMALKSDGTVLDYGNGFDPPNRAPEGLSNVVAISAGGNGLAALYSLALRSDGTVVAWNAATLPDGLTNVSAIAAGKGFSLLITTNPPQPMLAAAQANGKIAV